MFDRRKIVRWWRRTIAADKVGAFALLARGGLVVATLPFEAVTRMRNLFYDKGVLPVLKPPVPVIAFGNLTVGGTGKTPAVVWAASYLAEKGLRPGIASRGYNPENPSDDANDEAALIAETLPDIPHVWNADRAAAAASLVKDHSCDCVILDDAFQHRRLHRTLDFLLIDALNPFGFGYMLPRGLLREPVSSLARATCIIITHANLVSTDELVRIRRRIWDIEEGVKLAEAVHRPTALVTADGAEADPETLREKRVFAFCGIGNPFSFIQTLSNLGADVVGLRTFTDHHAYTPDEIDAVFAEAASRNADYVLTTQKDRVKVGWRADSIVPLAELRIEFEIVRGRETVGNLLDFLAAAETGSASA